MASKNKSQEDWHLLLMVLRLIQDHRRRKGEGMGYIINTLVYHNRLYKDDSARYLG